MVLERPEVLVGFPLIILSEKIQETELLLSVSFYSFKFVSASLGAYEPNTT